MERAITGYHLDSLGDWVAELSCGHGQHVRHDPPWQEREWVVSPVGRASRVGVLLNCKRCDELALEVAEYVLARVRDGLRSSASETSLCEEGRVDLVVDSVNHLVPAELVASFKPKS